MQNIDLCIEIKLIGIIDFLTMHLSQIHSHNTIMDKPDHKFVTMTSPLLAAAILPTHSANQQLS